MISQIDILNIVDELVHTARIYLVFNCSVVCLREELLVATGIGWLQRIRWDGMINSDMTIEVSSIPFSVDLQQSRGNCSRTGLVLKLQLDLFVTFANSSKPFFKQDILTVSLCCIHDVMYLLMLIHFVFLSQPHK